MRKVFDQPGDWVAMNAAEAWCEASGISVGHMQGPAPRGLLVGNFAIAKWRNLTTSERWALHGQMTGDMRHGPVEVELIDGHIEVRDLLARIASQPGGEQPCSK